MIDFVMVSICLDVFIIIPYHRRNYWYTKNAFLKKRLNLKILFKIKIINISFKPFNVGVFKCF